MMPRSDPGGRAGDQGSLRFDNAGVAEAPRSRRTDPSSSALAAQRIGKTGARQQAAIILEAIRRHPGRTAEELEEPTGLHKSAIGKRLPELRRAGLIERVGESSRGARFFPVERTQG